VSRRQITWLSPTDPADAFPPVEAALDEPDGLLAAGGDLSVPRLLAAYRLGIFPWFEEGQPILWWSPDPRCVMRPGEFHVSRSLRRALRTSGLKLMHNTAFDDVMRACAEPRPYQSGTWITADMISAYECLHRNGWAHSLEVWSDDELVGGVYGLAIGKVFFGESMFSRVSNASKFALLGLCRVLESNRFELLDCQVVSRHLTALGASMIPRSEFSHILAHACESADRFENWPEDPISVRGLAALSGPAALQ